MAKAMCDISCGVERECVSIENAADLLHIVDFVYVRTNVPGLGTNLDDFTEQYVGCDCTGGCHANCSCATRFGASYNDNGRLTNDFDWQHDHMKPVVECNRMCTCTADCHRRLVQHGLKCRLEVFRTHNRGFGLRTLEPICKYSFVCEYAGEVIARDVAKKRSAMLSGDDCNYTIAVREHLGSGEVLKTYIDPMYIGNVGRFINHSCQPNLFMVPVRVDNCCPKLALFAVEDIATDSELCYNYSGRGQRKSVTETDEHSDTNDRKLCLCGSTNCQGYLPFEDYLFD